MLIFLASLLVIAVAVLVLAYDRLSTVASESRILADNSAALVDALHGLARAIVPPSVTVNTPPITLPSITVNVPESKQSVAPMVASPVIASPVNVPAVVPVSVAPVAPSIPANALVRMERKKSSGGFVVTVGGTLTPDTRNGGQTVQGGETIAVLSAADSGTVADYIADNFDSPSDDKAVAIAKAAADYRKRVNDRCRFKHKTARYSVV